MREFLAEPLLDTMTKPMEDCAGDRRGYTKAYAEKLIVCYPGQVPSMHYHYSKMEDLINRGGNGIYFPMYNATSVEDDQLPHIWVRVNFLRRKTRINVNNQEKTKLFIGFLLLFDFS